MNEQQRKQVLQQLRKGEWFGGLPETLQNLIVDGSILRTFVKGQIIQLEGQPAPGMGVVLEGQVAMIRHVGDEDPALLHVGGPGFWFGHLSVLQDDPIVSGIAQTAARVLILPKREFDRIVADEPRYYPAFAQLVFERFRILLRYFSETIRLPAEGRLRLRLADLADVRRADATVPGRDVVLDISQAELADIVGLSRQRLNILLKALVKERWIEASPRRIRVLDPNGLRASAVGGAVNAEELAGAPRTPRSTRQPTGGRAPPSGD